MQGWLLGTYISLLLGRVLVVLINCMGSTDTLIGLVASCFSVFVLLPFLAIWTLLGTFWYAEIVYNHQEDCVRDI